MKPTPNQIQYLDSLRTMATVGVILIHITSPLMNMTWNRNMPYWLMGDFATSLVRFAVPVFLLLSGATLLGKDYSLKDFYLRRFSRVVIPFLFWLPVYWIFRWTTLKPQQQPHDFQSIMDWAVELFLHEGVSKHFWYVYMIIFIYLAIPFIRKTIRQLSINHLIIISFIWIIFAYFIKNTPMNAYGWNGNFLHKFTGYFTYSGYLILGYTLTKIDTSKYHIRNWSAFVFVATWMIAALGSYFLSMNGQKQNLILHGYLHPNTIFQAVSLFLLLKDIHIQNPFILKIQNTISQYSYGVYLVHIIVLGILWNNRIYWNITHPLLSLPLLTIVTLLTSWCIIYLLRKIPGGKHISG